MNGVSYVDAGKFACHGPLARLGFVRESVVTTSLQWACILVAITFFFIVLLKSGSSTVDIGDLRALAITFLIGSLLGVGAFYMCKYVKGKPSKFEFKESS